MRQKVFLNEISLYTTRLFLRNGISLATIVVTRRTDHGGDLFSVSIGQKGAGREP